MELAKAKNPFVRKDMSKAEALAYFTEKGDEYKLDLLEGLEDGTITFYTQGEFTDLPGAAHPAHRPHQGGQNHGHCGCVPERDETQKQLTRVYGVTFTKKSELKEHLELRAGQGPRPPQAWQGTRFVPLLRKGQGLPLWLPKGADLRMRLENFLKEAQRKSGYEPVITPHIGNKDLYVTSGHYAKYGEDSFQPIHTPAEGGVLAQAYELPAPLQIFCASTFLPRFARAFGRVRNRVPLRKAGSFTA